MEIQSSLQISNNLSILKLIHFQIFQDILHDSRTFQDFPESGNPDLVMTHIKCVMRASFAHGSNAWKMGLYGCQPDVYRVKLLNLCIHGPLAGSALGRTTVFSSFLMGVKQAGKLE